MPFNKPDHNISVGDEFKYVSINLCATEDGEYATVVTCVTFNDNNKKNPNHLVEAVRLISSLDHVRSPGSESN